MIYWNPYPLLSYNADINLVIGPRSIGKTYKEKILALKDFFKNKSQFIFLRQTDTQLDLTKSKFLNDLKANQEFNGRADNLFIKGDTVYYRNNEEEIEEVGYFSSLNVVSNQRGFTTTNKLKWYFLDEFISETNTYLKNEIMKFVSSVSTFFRLRNNGKVILSANALSMDNPYLNFFKIKIPKEGSFSKSVIPIQDPLTGAIYNLVVVCEFVKPSNEFVETSSRSLGGKLALLSGYGESSINNRFILDDTSNIVERKLIKCPLQCSFNVFFNGIDMGIYKNTSHNIIFVGEPLKNYKTYVFNDIVKASEPNCVLALRKNNIYKLLLNYQVNGYMVYESLNLKNAFFDFLNSAK